MQWFTALTLRYVATSHPHTLNANHLLCANFFASLFYHTEVSLTNCQDLLLLTVTDYKKNWQGYCQFPSIISSVQLHAQ
ncbi:TPA: hypothetical protein U1C77_001113 [Streptococcus suis]|nr:hypothetical protein [Streptococcus sp.]HEM3610280.1 hypothetical protein [Streptococcus suis]HEM3665464.1 hypothetical protein [Streptococcus suis]HEM3690230.1 hypothetical protein [Streptococcus suis]